MPLGPFNNLYGMGASPVLVDDLVMLVCDQNTGSFIVALGQRTDACAGGRRGPRRTAATRRQSCTRRRAARRNYRAGLVPLTAYAVGTGEKLWWVRGLSFELKSTPVVSGDILYINGFGTPENQPGAQKAIEPFDEIMKQHAEHAGS